jgi:outer membrane protein OmpA-like peptidoglycan-associated protein
MRLRSLLAAATCLALPSLAHAQPVAGPYVSLGAGTAIENSSSSDWSYFFESSQQEHITVTSSFKNQFRPSYAGVTAAGYGFGNGFRIELGGDFIRNTFHHSDLSAGATGSLTFPDGDAPVYGGEEKYGPMVNAYYDFSVGLPVFPYIGAGVGYQWVKLNRDYHFVNSIDFVPLPGGAEVGGTEGSFAYDIIAGLSYPLPTLPQLSLTAEYRFMQLTASRNYPFIGLDASLDAEVFHGLTKFKMGQESYHSFLIGLRYQLFAPPAMAPATPAPMASPAPASAKTYLVFFDWDKYNLTPRATQIIAEAASDSKTTSTTTIDVSGYTDTSGTPTYNQGLSERRAKAVAAKLVSDGVPASEISIHAYGETHLLVPTGPGVREPQNRRVEIVLN